jgi:predicted NACHT family NTPase
LTFQEYFAAREIVASSNPHAFDAALKKLVSHVTEPRWREVFLLVVGMLRNADYMLQLMKQKIDSLLATDDRLQTFLIWVNQKHRSVSVSYKPAVVRAFYFDLALAQALTVFGSTLDLTRTLDRNITRGLDPTLALDLALDRTLTLDRVVERSSDPHPVFENVLARSIERAQVDEPGLARELQHLKQQLFAFGSDKKQFRQWWKINGQAWMEQLRGVAIAKRNLGHNWQFSKQQRDALKQYYYANQLLVECLNSNYYITRTMRSQIENTLLLPIAQIN